jgi:hypothetical protein
MIVRVVQFAEPFGRDALDVGSPTDRRMMVGMLAECGCGDGLRENARRVVVVALEFVAHDRHFRAAIRIRDERIAHAIGFHLDREIEISGRYGLKVIRAIDPGRGVFRRADLVHHVRKRAADTTIIRGRSLEEHVLEKMRRARIADGFVARPDAIHDEQRGDRRGRSGDEHDLESVIEHEFFGGERDRHQHPG